MHVIPISRVAALGAATLLGLGIILVPALDRMHPATSVGQGSSSWMLGQGLYEQHCAACHGTTGDGQGPASVWLLPKPRDFGPGLFKVQSTPPGSLPTDEDLFRVLTRGMPGSSMPGFAYLSEEERWALVEYVKLLTVAEGGEGEGVSRFALAEETGEMMEPIVVPAEPPFTFESITSGREVYERMQCAACHGDTGAGDGPSAPTLRDNWGIPLPPRDFNASPFRGGHTGVDLYLRIAAGMAGTPMTPFGDDLMTPDDRWALVHYIQSLRRKDIEVSDILAPDDPVIPVSRMEGRLPMDPLDPVWEWIEAIRVPLNPLWPEPYPIPAVAVRALHDDVRLVLLLQWRDAVPDGAPVRIEDFQDGVAVQFALNGIPPFLGMGDAENPVNIWFWKAGWQETVAGVHRDVRTVYPSIHVDVEEHSLLYRTAAAAGNLIAAPPSTPVEDANARGFGTLTAQPPEHQNVHGAGVWRDGFWNVVFTRLLDSGDPDDVRLPREDPVPVAFAVWDGQQGDRNGRKVISNWYLLDFQR